MRIASIVTKFAGCVKLRQRQLAFRETKHRSPVCSPDISIQYLNSMLDEADCDRPDVTNDEPPAEEPPQLAGGTFRALRHRNYRLYFAGQFISLLGTWMQTPALSWLAYH